MATATNTADSARHNPADLFSTFDRRTIASAVEVLIAVLDTMDGDPDFEEDDPSGQCDEDEINTVLWAQWGHGPGCTIADAGEYEH